MNIAKKLDHRWVVDLSHLSRSWPQDTTGKVLMVREHLVPDETIFVTAGCSLLDVDFVLRHYWDVFTEGYHEKWFQDLSYAIDHRLFPSEVEAYRGYSLDALEPVSSAVWRNSKYNLLHHTVGVEYVGGPQPGFIESLKKDIALGEYRLGVF